MPIPFYRPECDDRDFTWYELLFMPIYVPTFLVFLATMSLLEMELPC
ncbi:MAG: hypothetical protein K2X87_31990 [Gemmataceae bacterium]|nr:hypothetical protein [Gemmataceae bacterium]